MRPEIREYNYDRLMAGMLNAAAKVPAGTEKETVLTYRYIPNFTGVARSFINAGPATFEVLTAIGSLVWKRGMFDYMDYCVEVGMPETSCSAQRVFLFGAWRCDYRSIHAA